MHNNEVHDLYFSSHIRVLISWRVSLVAQVAHTWKKVIQVFLRGDNLEGLGQDNIKTDLKETVWQQAVLVPLTTQAQFHLQVSPHGIFC